MARFLSFYGQIIFYCIYMYIHTHTTSLSIHSFTGFRLCPYLGSCKSCCSEHGGRDTFSKVRVFVFLDYPKVQFLDHLVVLFLIGGGGRGGAHCLVLFFASYCFFGFCIEHKLLLWLRTKDFISVFKKYIFMY